MLKFTSILLAVLLWPAGAVGQVAPAYRATLIADFWGDMHINDQGVIALTRYGTPYTWSRGTGLTPIATGAVDVLIRGFNNEGTAVGSAMWPPHNEEMTYYLPVASVQGGPFERVNDFGRSGGAAGINNHGTIVGGVQGGFGDSWYRRGFMQRDGQDTQFVDFIPQAINDAGAMVGVGLENDGATIAGIKVWRDGQLSTLEGVPGERPMFINQRGWIAGTTDDYQPWLWRDGALTQLWNGTITDMNDAGVVIGEYYIGRTVLWFEDQVYEIGERWHEAGWEGWELAHLATINEKGEIGALLWDEGFGQRMVLLSPVPEPGLALQLAAGLALLGAMRLRKARRSA
ncbi:hypothetical protein [Pseudoduganella sp.]|uniref:hypothetical protein n=1 Tax=Pseudoduganella sp. TaxID=1880898 RepID=UPI0035ADBE21